MKIKWKLSAEEKGQELTAIKNYMENGIFLLACLELLGEFVQIPYLDHMVITVSFAEWGLFLHGFFLQIVVIRSVEFSKEKFNPLIEFHHTFITSIVIPMIFVFSDTNTSYAHLENFDVELLKKVSVLVVMLALGYYKVMTFLLLRVNLEYLSNERRERTDVRFSCIAVLGGLLDLAVFMCMYWLFAGMMNLDEDMALTVSCSSAVIVGGLTLVNRIKERIPVVKGTLLVLVMLILFFGAYDIYLKKGTKEYHFEQGDYYFLTEFSEGGKLEQYCRLDDEEGETLKYVMVYTNAQGEIQTGGAVYQYNATQAVKGIFRWYDHVGTVVPKRYLERGDIPVLIQITQERTESDPNLPLTQFVDKTNYIYLDKEGNAYEWIVVRQDSLLFRNTLLGEVTEIPENVAQLFAELTLAHE